MSSSGPKSCQESKILDRRHNKKKAMKYAPMQPYPLDE